jgi:hypothetical protein
MTQEAREMWQFINSFADWFSAAGTIAAVAVALFLAARDRRIRLIPRAAHQVILVPNLRSNQEIVGITETNKERRTAILTGLYLKTGIRKKSLFQLTSVGLLQDSSGFPQELYDGKQAHYRYLTSDFQKNAIPEFVRFYPRISRGIWRGIWLRSMRIGVETSVGKTFEQPIHATLRRWLSEQLHASRFVHGGSAG